MLPVREKSVLSTLYNTGGIEPYQCVKHISPELILILLLLRPGKNSPAHFVRARDEEIEQLTLNILRIRHTAALALDENGILAATDIFTQPRNC